MEATHSSEMFVTICQTTRRHIPSGGSEIILSGSDVNAVYCNIQKFRVLIGLQIISNVWYGGFLFVKQDDS
jgi:hypothetical protein